LTSVATFVAGGLKEAVRYFKREINYFKNVRFWSVIITGFSFGILGAYTLAKVA